MIGYWSSSPTAAWPNAGAGPHRSRSRTRKKNDGRGNSPARRVNFIIQSRLSRSCASAWRKLRSSDKERRSSTGKGNDGKREGDGLHIGRRCSIPISPLSCRRCMTNLGRGHDIIIQIPPRVTATSYSARTCPIVVIVSFPAAVGFYSFCDGCFTCLRKTPSIVPSMNLPAAQNQEKGPSLTNR